MTEPEYLKAWDGLFPVLFTGDLLANSTSEKTLEPGQDWYEMAKNDPVNGPRIQKLFLRWVEMELYYVHPGQTYLGPDDDDLIRLPDGGYFLHIIGLSDCYHAENGCRKGIPRPASKTSTNVLPCPDCKPPLIWHPDDLEAYDAGGAKPEPRTGPDFVVKVETPRHTLYRAENARGIVNAARTGVHRSLTGPATQLIEEARDKDPAIAAVFAPRPAPPRIAS